MQPVFFWLSVALAAGGLGMASVETHQFLQVMSGLEKAGVLGESRSNARDILPASEVSAKTSDIASVNPSLAVAQPQVLSLTEQLDRLAQLSSRVWGDQQALVPSQSQVVKYSPDWRSRFIIDFKAGKLIVESLSERPVDAHQMLVRALLTPDNSPLWNVLSTAAIDLTGKPFLLGQVVDSLGKPIDSMERATRFAAWALVNRSEVVSGAKGNLRRIALALDPNHKQVRAAKFAPLLEAVASEYRLDVNLLYAITEIESHFNPLAVSRSGAVGLMQLMSGQAGRDAMKVLTGQDRLPTDEELRDPEINIRLGAIYIALLQEHYLKEVQNPHSRELAVIAAYNGGASRALKVFGHEKSQAIANLNLLPPQIVYDALKQRHSSAETRGYVEKVMSAKKRYSTRV